MKVQRMQRDSFLVRIWREKDRPEWQGWVQHTRSGESTFVRDLRELQAFCERWTGKLTNTKRQGLEQQEDRHSREIWEEKPGLQ